MDIHSLCLDEVIDLYVNNKITSKTFKDYRDRAGISMNDYDWQAVEVTRFKNKKEYEMAETLKEVFIVQVFEEGESIGYADQNGFLVNQETESCYFNEQEAKEMKESLQDEYPDCMVVIDSRFI